ncbi:hypothetical protein KH5H1_53660 [Corallococcus caeni]|nr:hypothetical protein KH5H1_53660 [Corallococcus sp. KH5-1]
MGEGGGAGATKRSALLAHRHAVLSADAGGGLLGLEASSEVEASPPVGWSDRLPKAAPVTSSLVQCPPGSQGVSAGAAGDIVTSLAGSKGQAIPGGTAPR